MAIWQTPGAGQPGLGSAGRGNSGVDPYGTANFTTAALLASTLDLQFAGAGTLDSRITYTGGNGSFFNAAGTLVAATTNQARFDYDPATHAARGLLVEESRTNLLLNNATLGTQSVAVTAQAYTLSFYGTGTVTLSGVSTAGPLVGSAATTRVSLTFTPTAGTLTLTVSGSVLNANLEAGSFATSVIPTAGATVTRTADVPTMPFLAAASGTFAVEAMLPANNNANFAMVLCVDDGSTNNRDQIYISAGSNGVNTISTNGGVNSSNAAIGTMTPGTIFKVAITYNPSPNEMNYFNGVAQGQTFAAMPYATFTTLRLGVGPGPVQWADGYIRRVRYWPRVLNTDELQAVTT